MDTAVVGSDAMAKLAKAEMECLRLRAENEDLRHRLENTAPATASGSLPESPSFRRATSDAADRLVAELQRRLLDVLQRNSFLEQQSHVQQTALIQTYDGYIKRLEEELRRCQMLLKQGQS